MIGMSLSGHIGSLAADLVDCRLPAHVEERAWQHVFTCAGCRQRVESEGWAKQQLTALGAAQPTPESLMGSLRQLEDLDSWLDREPISARTVLVRASVALAGAGSLGVAVLAWASLSAPPTVTGETTHVPASIHSGLPSPVGDPVRAGLPGRSK